MDIFVVANGARELNNFQIAACKFTIEQSTRFVKQVLEPLRREHRIYVARNWSFYLQQIVIRQRLGEHNLHGSGGSAGVIRNFHGHRDSIVAEDRLLWIGMARQDRESAVNL